MSLESGTARLYSCSWYMSYHYANNKLITENFEKAGTFYHQKTFQYNQTGLLEKETCKTWDNFEDSTMYYYNEDETLYLSREGHFRSGQNTGLFADSENLTLYGEHNKWRLKYSFFKTGEMFERIDRFFNENNLLIAEIRYDYREHEVKKTTSTYTYKYYAD